MAMRLSICALLNNERVNVNVNMKSNNGSTAFILASEQCHLEAACLEVARSLLKNKGADVNIQDRLGYTALIRTSERLFVLC